MLPLWLLVLAIVARGLVPWVHGPVSNGDAKNGVLLAFCGTSSAALLAQAVAISPWKSALPANSNSPRSGGGNSSNLCPVCVVAASAVLIAALAILFLRARTALPGTRRRTAPPVGISIPAYHPRGPPAQFLLSN